MYPIRLRGARTHNLQRVDLDLQPGELLVITGLSGAGKSSLAFDTLYSEGQRRFVESFSPYARQFLERLERPPMDSLDPVAAGVAVDRRAPIKSSRSTLATMADLEAFLSALFLREAKPLCPDCNVLAEARDPNRAAKLLSDAHAGARALVSYPVRVEGTESFLDARELLLRDGYRRVVFGGKAHDLDGVRPSDALAAGGVLDVLVDRIRIAKRGQRRVAAALEEAWRQGDGSATVHLVDNDGQRLPNVRGLACPSCGRAFEPPSSGLFSYQSPVGACSGCRGFGRVLAIDWRKVIPNPSLSLKQKAIRPWGGKKTTWERRMLRQYCEEHGIPMDVPWGSLSEAHREMIMQGAGVRRRRSYFGLCAWFQWLQTKAYKMHVRVLLARYRAYDPCLDCNGKRLSPRSLGYRVDGLDLGAWHQLELRDALARLRSLEVSGGQGAIAKNELIARLDYLERVGLGYLTLDRQARTLSGGEAQRVSLTAALGSSLTGALFVLDEPTVGLHPGDVPPLIDAMRELAHRGNAVVVIEHDASIIAAAERIVELGPGAGRAGGKVVFDGTPAAARRRTKLACARALARSPVRRSGPFTPSAELRIVGASANNLQDVSVSLPLNAVVAVCGPSGSGKSTLIDEVLRNALARLLGDFNGPPPGDHTRIEGAAAVSTLTLVDQSPLGRTSRGNAATYSGAWSQIRSLYAARPEAIARHFTPAHFSFNVAAGRCEVCAGEGAETVEMQFLADVRLTCPVCKGKRFREEVLAIAVDGLSIADTLAQSADEALERFATDRTIQRCLQPLAELGLGYLPLGQPLSTLSGGEAQRLKLARALRKVKKGTLLLLDEPSAGLHADEVGLISNALEALVAAGASAIVVDHDVRVIGAADWVVELGPGAGSDGGRVVAECTPADLVGRATATGKALASAQKAPAKRRPGKRSRPTRRAKIKRSIEVLGAREHNLRNVDVTIPHGKLVVVTGPSGSGKSSLAFDVVFAEGQRRFLETLTPYARQFLPIMPRPNVDRVSGVPPSVALEQRTARAGASSTVATVTEIAHYLRLLFAKVGEAHCPDCDVPVRAIDRETLFARLRRRRGKMSLRAIAVSARKGTYLEVFSAADLAGIEYAIVDGKLAATDQPPKLARTREHTIELIVYEGRCRDLDRSVFERALRFGRGQLVVARYQAEAPEDSDELLSTARACPSCERAIPELDPRWFSFNTRQGRCAGCEGTGVRGGLDAVRESLRAPADEAKPLPLCKRCEGARLAPIPRAVRLDDERYHEHMSRSVSAALARLQKLSFSGDAKTIAEAPLRELLRRLRFVDQVGLGYLGLDRRAASLSGGEMQRLRLAAQLGSGLTGALYVLDEPTIGLHPSDTQRLLDNLRALVDTGSTVMVVEHDSDTIRAADHLIDLGPAGGRGGGRIMAQGPPAKVLANEDSPTGRALAQPSLPRRLKPISMAKRPALVLTKVAANNLRIDEVRIPLGCMVVVAGVSGSGKSTLVGQVLYPALRRHLGRTAAIAGKHGKLTVPATLKRALAVDQAPIGRSSRSVPATFLGIWDQVRRLFASLPEARTRGYKPARFSFNSGAGGGRCELCKGNGAIAHEMAFLPDVKTVCAACHGMRFEDATLDVRYHNLSIGDVLRLTVDESCEVFRSHRKIITPLATLRDLGVGYVQLGQGSPTLSGGEAQRLKLAKELTAGRDHKPTLYVLDEPTTGLHHSDVARLVLVLDRLVQRGDSLLIIEHHPAVIAAADHIIELGPGGGEAGGRVVAQGAPAKVRKAKTATGEVLRRSPH